jgi:putative acetyltransferase
MPVTDDAVEQVRANPDDEYRLIADIDGRVVGIGVEAFEKAELRACYVAPEACRRGIGSALVRELERAARDRGLTHLDSDSSVTAERFYRKAGFDVIKRGEHVLHNRQRTACVKMRKILASNRA